MSFRRGDRVFLKRTGTPVIVRYVTNRGFVDIEAPDGRTIARVEDLTLDPPVLDSYPHGRAAEQIHNQKAEEEPMSETVTIALTAKDIAEWHGGGSYVGEKITALLPDPSPLIEPGLKYRHVTANPDTVNWERVRLVDWESDEVITETVDGERHVQPLSRIQDQFHLGQLVEIEEQA